MEHDDQADVIRHGFFRAGRPLRILVVDDMQDAAMILGIIMKRMGHKVRLAYDGPSALALGNELEPEVVFLDLDLRGYDGVDICRTFRRSPWGTNACIIAVTGRAGREHTARSLRAGFDRHIVKPMDLGTLRAILDRAERRAA